MKYFILLFIFFSTQILFACTFTPDSFCRSLNDSVNDLILSGRILDKDDDGLDLEVLEIFGGEESRSVIRIWDGTDWDCNGLVDLSVRHLGEINDTIVIMLPKIDSLENDWEILGDYRRPNYTSTTTSLKVENGRAHGFIQGDITGPFESIVYELDFETLLYSLRNDLQCEDFIVGTNELYQTQLSYTNPFTSELIIREMYDQAISMINIYSLDGKRVMAKNNLQGLSEISINLQQCEDGFYLLEVVRIDQSVQRYKVVKS